MFFVGILVYELRGTNAGWAHRIGPGTWWLTLLVALGLYAGLNDLSRNMDAQFTGRLFTLLTVLSLAVPFYVLFAACLAPASRAGAPFGATPLRWLGNMSYSYYLVHSLAVHLAALLLLHARGPAAPADSPLLYWTLLLPVLGASLVAGAVLFLVVERPVSLRTEAG